MRNREVELNKIILLAKNIVTDRILYLNVIFWALYYLANLSDINLITNIVGLTYLLVVLPYTLVPSLFRNTKDITTLDKYFACLVLFFFLYVPIFYILFNRLGVLKLNESHVTVYSLGFFLLVYLIRLVTSKNDDGLRLPSWIELKQAFGRGKILILFLLFYILLHRLNYYFYRFMPEMDGYGYLEEIERAIAMGRLQSVIREYFSTMVAVLAIFTKIAPYNLFAFWFILLQTSLILVLYRFMALFDLKTKLSQILVLAATFALPVLNMEIDMTRPQNVVIIFLPIYIYFFYRAVSEKKNSFWFLSSLIVLFSLNYHQFFYFFLVFHLIWTGVVVLNRIWLLLRSDDSRDKTIFWLGFLSLALSIYFINDQTNILESSLYYFRQIRERIQFSGRWRWWFLGSYSTDGPPVGWPGLSGAVKYYAYYISPIIFLLAPIFIWLRARRPMEFKTAVLPKTIAPLLIVFIFFAEITPRLNYVLLPERFWIFIDILLLILAVLFFKILENHYWQGTLRKAVTVVCLTGTLIGLGGSLYIARGKKAFTTPEEYRAAKWIKENTPPDSVFITQTGNRIMVEYFAGRFVFIPKPDYFVTGVVGEVNWQPDIDRLLSSNQEEWAKVQESLNAFVANDDLEHMMQLKERIELSSQKIRANNQQISAIKEAKNVQPPGYVLYSTNKLDSLYSLRDWWRAGNFPDANLKLFDQLFSPVYKENGVYIWKISE